MAKQKGPIEDPGTWIFRDIPRDLMRKAKAVTAMQGKSVRGLVLELVKKYVEDWEKKGGFPKGK